MILTLKDACKRVRRSTFFIALVAAVMMIPGGARADTPAPTLATFNAATDVPIISDGYSVVDPLIRITLNFAPAAGTILTVVNNTGLDFIQGTFGNLPHGSIVNLSFGGTVYPFVANYYGGTGNDLVLQWAGSAVVAWGYNNFGQLGNNSTASSSVPVMVDTSGVLLGKTILSVVGGSAHNLVLCSDGTVASWGYNVYGQLGNNSRTDSAVPVLVDQSGVLRGKTVVALATGQYFSVALCSDGTLAAWGAGGYLGASMTGSVTAPVLVDRSGVLANKKVVGLAAGLDHTLALCSDGAVVGWGSNSNAQLGTGSTVYSAMGPVAVDRSGVLSSRKVIKISAGQYHSLALCSDGTLAAWGFNFYGQLGTAGGNNASPAVVNTGAMAGKTVVDMVADGVHNLAQCPDGTLLSWGYNDYGQLGIGSRGFNSMPVAVSASGALSGKTVTALSGGAVHSLALCSDGTVAAWGHNRYGALGNNNMVDAYTPVAVAKSSLGEGARFMTATGGSMALHSVGLVGLPVGILPLVEVVSYNSAVDVPITSSSYDATGKIAIISLHFPPSTGTTLTVIKNTGLDFIQGTFNNLAQGQMVSLEFDGIPYSFVANYYGGTGNDLVLQWANSIVAAWGYNGKGELGNNSTESSAAPIPVNASGVLAGKTVTALCAGNEHSLALCSDGTLATWGYGGPGTLGNYAITDSNVPVRVYQTGVLAGKRVIAVAAGEIHCLVLCSDGTLAAWGGNANGQLGNNSTVASNAPVRVIQAGVLAGKKVVAISAGAYHNLALCSDGTLAAWGWNYYGQLGNNSQVDSSVPVLVDRTGVLLHKSIVSAVAGRDHSLVLSADGTISCWGSNFAGALGILSAADSSVPVAMNQTGALLGKTVVSISSAIHNFALCSDGTLAAWGWNGSGEYGNGTTSYSPNPVPVAVTRSGVLDGKTVDAVWAGTSSGMARTTDGKLVSWGRIWANLFVSGSTDNNLLPVAVSTQLLPPDSYVVTAAGGTTAGHSLAIVALPVAPRLAVELSTGTSLTSDISTVGFGSIALNSTVHKILNIKNTGNAPLTFQGVGIGGPEGGYFRSSVLPRVLNAGASTSLDLTFTPLAEIAARATLTISSNDPAHPSFKIELEGDGNPSVPPVIVANYQSAGNVPLTISRINATNIGVAFSLSFAPPVGTNLTVVNNTGRQFIQGVFMRGRLMPGGGFMQDMNMPILWQGQHVTLTYGGKNYDFVANYFGGTGNDLVLEWADTVAVGWGYNGQGQLGNGTASSSALPVKVDDSGVLRNRTVITMATGMVHSLALCADGMIAAWGVNGYGELGNGSTTHAFVPIAVSRSGVLEGKTVAAIAVGQYHSLALCSDGTVAAWGSNDFGQLGNGGTAQSSVPVRVNFSGSLAGKAVIAIAAGQFHSLALCLDGTVAAWGSNIDGGLGNNSTTDSLVPVAVDATGVLAGKTVVGISAGQYHSLAVCSDGTLAAWGGNIFGALGNNSSANSPVPVAVNAAGVLAGKTPVAVAAGQFHSVALCSDGTVAAWGANFYGALGDSTTLSSATPVAVNRSGVLAGKTVTRIAAASLHSLAYCSDGTVATWGYNGVGQLGVDTPIFSSVPVTVDTGSLPAGSRCIAATTGSMASHNLALLAIVPVPELLVLDSSNLPLTSGETVNYGRVDENDQLVKAFTVKNTGRVTLTFSMPTFAGTSASEFNLQTQLRSVPPGASASLEIAYRPLTDAPDLATFTVATNDPLVPVFTLSLSGGGMIPSLAPLIVDLDGANQASVTQSYLYATGRNVTFFLNFPPAADTSLTVVSNTGAEPIKGTFKNLAQGQLVELKYLRTSYLFVANYFGGDGNDLVLEWAPGSYYGLVQAQTGTARSLSTEGSFSAFISSSRTFTGKLTIGTAFFPVSGTFGTDGVATFGAKKERSLVFPRGALPTLTFALKFGDKGSLSGTVTQTLQGVVQGVSTVQADHATNASSITVNGNYSVLLPSIPPGSASPQTQGLTTSDYPQAPGFGSLTLSKTGSASFTLSLPDGTVFSIATILVGRSPATLSLPLFASAGKGVSVSATVSADTVTSTSDFSTGTGHFFWVKGPSTSAYYPAGWPLGIVTQLFAARYQAPAPGQSMLPGLAPANPQGNAVLQVDQEVGTVSKTYPVNININNTVSYAFPATPGLTLTLTPATGMFNGSFLAPDNSRVTYKGTVYQRGTALFGGRGFYLSPLARVRGATGEGRAVMLNPR